MQQDDGASHRKTVSVIIPALNEERFLRRSVGVVADAAPRHFRDYEIIIVDDGSTDGTGRIADELAAADGRISVIHHDRPHNLGGAFKSGLTRAGMDFVTLYHGKGGNTAEEMSRIWERAGSADIIVPYTLNSHERPVLRRLISHGLTSAIGLVAGLKLKYYMHLPLYRREDLNGIEIRTCSYAFQAEALCKLIRGGCSYCEVGVTDAFEDGGRTRSYRWRNSVAVIACLFRLLWDLRVRGRKAVRDRSDPNLLP
ncbi:MAG: glycosyltransferase family 2 protein [Verrucomicrobia bacterium]|jgi:glycosyltransferase involved in cell wall biosynthesis|nr:glycosyltransferase family 2 protein [Verrucomicrobiota bacterium]MBT7068236.1 glycosyltransferase family 2 protein [Verrucomicrobiota bacterium]MBT7699628.1 glycosyltransferase family 2 protein [Verrucomicrobiota bacterium]